MSILKRVKPKFTFTQFIHLAISSRSANTGTFSDVAVAYGTHLNFYIEFDRVSELTATCFGQHGVTACVGWEGWWGLSYSVMLVAQSESIVLF